MNILKILVGSHKIGILVALRELNFQKPYIFSIVQKSGIISDLVVDFENGGIDRHEYFSYRFDTFQLSGGFALFEFGPIFGKIHEHDVSQLRLRIFADPDLGCHLLGINLDPLMLFAVLFTKVKSAKLHRSKHYTHSSINLHLFIFIFYYYL